MPAASGRPGRRQAIRALRPDAGGAEAAEHLAVRRHAGALEQEDVLHGDHVVLHAGELGDRRDPAGAVRQARDLDDQVDGRGDLLAHGALRQLQAGHRHHRVEAVERVARAVGVDRRQAAVVAGVHGLQHVQRLGAADLADDDAIGPHAQRVDDQVALLDRALALDVRRPGLEADDVALPQHQLGGVLDGDDPLAFRDEAGEHVQQRRLAGAGAAADDDVQPAGDGRDHEVEHRAGQRLAIDQVGAAQAIGPEPADREARAVEGERRDDGVDARAVGQPGVHHRARLVDAAPDRADDALDDLHQVLVVAEDRGALLDASLALDVDVVVAVDQDVRHGRILEQRLERSEAEQLVEDVDRHRLALVEAERRRLGLGLEQAQDQRPDLGLGLIARDAGQALEVEPVQQLLVDLRLDRLVVRMADIGGGGRTARRDGRRACQPRQDW